MLGQAKGIFFEENVSGRDLGEKNRTDSPEKETDLSERAKDKKVQGSRA